MRTKNTLGKRIRELRNGAGFSQEDFSLLLNITQGQLSRIENDVYEPNIAMLKTIKKVTKCDYDYLLEGKKQVQNSSKEPNKTVEMAM